MNFPGLTWRRVLRTPPLLLGGVPQVHQMMINLTIQIFDYNGAKHSPPGVKVTKVRGPPLCISGDPLSQIIICQMMMKLTIQISDYNDF